MDEIEHQDNLLELEDREESATLEVLLHYTKFIEAKDKQALRDSFKEYHEADIAYLLTLMSAEQRADFMALIGDELPADVYAEIDENIRSEIVEYMALDTLVTTVQALESDDAVFVLEDLDEDEQQEVLEQIPETDRIILQRALDYDEDSAGRLMRSEFVSVPPFWTVGQTIDHLREAEDLPDSFLEVFILDATYQPAGIVPLNNILRASRDTVIEKLAADDFLTLAADTDREQVARIFERYNLVSVAVTNEDGHMLGVITADDVFEVLSEEAEEDILRLGGVGDEAVTDSVWDAVRGRFSWLFVNLLTAIAASIVIALFDASIEKMVALAVLMPIVASMGGNAGTQTLTIAVRGLATRELMAANVRRIIMRELSVGMINGVLFAVIMGGVGAFWFQDVMLGFALGMAMIVTLIVAALAGILVPVGLERIGADPAIASSVFVTTVTDVIGFMAFLGFATILLLM